MGLADAIHAALLVLIVLACLGIAQRIAYRSEQQREWRKKYRTSSLVPPRRFPGQAPLPPK